MSEAIREGARPSTPLVRRGVLAFLIVVLANLSVRALGGLVVDLAAVEPLGWLPVVGSSIVGVVGATAVYTAIARVSARPDRPFALVAAVVLVLSLVPVATFAPTLPGVTTGVVVVMAVMHVVTAVAVVAVLPRHGVLAASPGESVTNPVE